ENNWCKGEELGVHHAMLVVGVGEDDDVSRIEEVLQTVRCWGRVRVRGRTFDVETSSLVALCECKEALNSPNVPSEVRPPDGSLPWKIVTANPALATSDEFAEKLKNFMLTEGKTVKDLQFFCQPPSPKDGTVESLIRAMGEFMNQSQKAPPENHSYRHLRTFSGVIRTPLGEDPFEHWMEQATIIESLKGPALEIVRALRFTDPEAKPGEYLDALNCAFGSAESGEDLYFSFRLIQQKSGEKLSDFARRLEPFLARVVQKGGIMAKDMDRVRVEQVLRGAVGADLMLLQLRLKERRERPPKFLHLLSEIRAEEEYERSREGKKTIIQIYIHIHIHIYIYIYTPRHNSTICCYIHTHVYISIHMPLYIYTHPPHTILLFAAMCICVYMRSRVMCHGMCSAMRARSRNHAPWSRDR
uniref:Uncharacterized protein n=1 Tax=Pygocentrus nattereri TaxID=42514 RepID=A0AAR2J958_PYGNA